MSQPPFTIPQYPLPTQFSDPYNDWMDDMTPCNVLGRAPSELSAHTLWHIFNGFLPVGNFEEMAAYIPRVLELLWQEPQDDYSSELLETFIIWCHVEQQALLRKENSPFLAAIQEATMELFKRWTSEPNSLYAEHIEHLLMRGDYISCTNWPPGVPWLRSEHFLPHLLATSSVAHAAWLLYAADEDKWSANAYPPLPLAPAIRLAAMDKVEDWLLTSATHEDIEFWDPIVTHTHEYFLRHPYHP